MKKEDRTLKLKLIKKNIQKFGYHTYVISGGSIPRFAYTIGLLDMIDSELIIAGTIYYNGNEVKKIIHSIYQQLKADKNIGSVFMVDNLGSFTIRQLDKSWTRMLLLGALDFYKISQVAAYQIIPDETHWTIDTPNLSKTWCGRAEPIWQWLHKEWTYPISSKSTATTNIAALRGAIITEVVRWEDDEWEMFAGPGPDVSFEESRVVQLGTLLANDPSLKPVVDLKIGEGLWRENYEGSPWYQWGPTEEKP